MPPAPVSTVATAVNEPAPCLNAYTPTDAFACLLDTVPWSVTRRPKTTVVAEAEIVTAGPTVAKVASAL